MTRIVEGKDRQQALLQPMSPARSHAPAPIEDTLRWIQGNHAGVVMGPALTGDHMLMGGKDGAKHPQTAKDPSAGGKDLPSRN